MANSYSTAVNGISIGSTEVFTPKLLGAIFGRSVPPVLKRDKSGSVPVRDVVAYLAAIGAQGIACMTNESEIVTPFTATALAEF